MKTTVADAKLFLLLQRAKSQLGSSWFITEPSFFRELQISKLLSVWERVDLFLKEN